jgi:rhodanese-related sulfurtransferase
VLTASILALGLGTAADRLFRTPPLGWRYTPAAQRIVDATTAGTLPQASINLVSLEESDLLLARADVVVLDARPRLFYELGHLPKAQSLSREEFETDFSRLEPALRGSPRSLLIYCADAHCEDAGLVARALQKLGLGPLLVFPGGVAEWEAAGRSLVVEP